MEQLTEAYVLALASVNVELAEVKKQYDTLLQQKIITNNVIEQLKEQRNEANTNLEKLKHETEKTILTLKKEIKHQKNELKTLENNMQALEDKANEAETKKYALQENLCTSYKELVTIYKEINTYKSKVIASYEELNTSNSQLWKCSQELQKKEHELIKLVEQQELLMLRRALHIFEKNNINIEDPTRRAEFWSIYFEDPKPKQILNNVQFNPAQLRETVKTLFLRMNSKIHEATLAVEEMRVGNCL